MPTPYVPPALPTGSSNSYGAGSKYIGNYANLPPGITNAGGTGDANAYVRAVQPNELASNQLTNLLDSNSAYIQNARQQGLRTANSRGLLNSSIAAGNSQMAAITAGAPIAQADATAYGAAANQNEDALNSILATRMNNETSEDNANTAAGASMYNSDIGLLNSRENRTYEGDQAGIGRSFQDYMAQQADARGQRRDAFNLGGSLLLNNDNFTHNIYSQNAQNPFAMANPDAMQGYIDYGNQNNASYYDNLFNYGTNGGQAPPNWAENSNWYTTPQAPTGGP